MLDSKTFVLPCGGEAVLDEASMCGHRCWTCMAIVGSVAMPKRCQELLDKQKQERRDDQK